MKRHWWKVPLYCMLVSVPCLYLGIFLLSRLAITIDKNDSAIVNNGMSLLIHGALFLIVVLLGGLLFFRKMTRREIFLSALVLSGINLVMGLLSFFTSLVGVLNFYWIYLASWDDVFNQILSYGRISMLLAWMLPPHVFILFGKKQTE